jgi:hypothetical protein
MNLAWPPTEGHNERARRFRQGLSLHRQCRPCHHRHGSLRATYSRGPPKEPGRALGIVDPASGSQRTPGISPYHGGGRVAGVAGNDLTCRVRSKTTTQSGGAGKCLNRGTEGCLPVSGVSAWNHVVSFAEVESFANGGFQSEEDGMNAAG